MKKYPIDPCPKCTDKHLPQHTCHGCIIKIEYEFEKREFERTVKKKRIDDGKYTN